MLTQTIDYAEIQVQDLNGNWFIAKNVYRINYQKLVQEMDMASQQFGGRRAKAVDQNGRLLDML